MKQFFTTLFIFFTSFVFSQQSKELKGFVKNEIGQTLSFSIIYNINTKQTFSANQYGAFVIEASLGDSLLISRISYKADTVIITKAIFYELKPFDIILKRKETILRDVNVSSRYKNDSIAKAYANLMKHDTLLNNNKKAENAREMAKPKLISNGGIGVEGLIYKTWYKFSDKGKSNEKLLKLVEIYNQSVKIDDKLSIDYIIKVTGVTAKKAEWIKEYCAKNALLKMPNFTDYDLIMVLRQCAE
ncbi:MAG: hypothetical protein JHD28_11375 [Bacteroidia bacterium]|nr:hypothetical protein [Bacteroidia bacterium]